MVIPQLSDAVVLYLGYVTDREPCRRAQAVIEAFGADAAALIASVDGLCAEAGRVPVDWRVEDLATAAHVVRGVLNHRHPELSENARSALIWDWAWANR
jgi:hypothetical protein